MLVLTRRVGEAIIIGDNIKVTVLMVERRKTRIGINAPKNVIVRREETCTQDFRNSQQSLKQKTEDN